MHRTSDPEASSGIGYLKLLSVILIFFLTYFCGILPYKWKSFNSSFKLLSYANVFAGGLFISMALIHLLPEASLTFNSHQSLEKMKQLSVYNPTVDSTSNIIEIDGIKYVVADTICQSPEFFPFPWAFVIVIITIAFCLFVEKVGFTQSYTHSHSVIIKSSSLKRMSKDAENENGIEMHEKIEEKLIENHKDEPILEKPVNFSPFLVLSALSIHSVFEALALGIILDFTFFINLFVAIMLHKWAESLSLAITFINNNFDPNKAKRYIFFFSLTAPSGIIVGWILSYISKLLAAVFFSISSGTFIYITLMEVLPDEFEIEEEKKHKWIKFILFNVGFVLITAVWFIEA